MTAPPATAPTPTATSPDLRPPKRNRRAEAERHKAAQEAARVAELEARQARLADAQQVVEQDFASAQAMPRPRRLYASDPRIGGPSWPLVSR